MHLTIVILFPFAVLGRHIPGPRQSAFQEKHESSYTLHNDRSDFISKLHSVHKRHDVNNVPHHHGNHEVDFATGELVRPVDDGMVLLYKLGVLGKMIKALPFTSYKPTFDKYNDRYVQYDAQLPQHVLTNSNYESAY